MRHNPNGFASGHATMASQDLVSKEVYGECPERKDRRIKSKTQDHDIPIRRVKAKHLAEVELIDLSRLAQFVTTLRPRFQAPIDQRRGHAKYSRTDCQQQRPPPTRGPSRALGIKRGVSPRRRVVRCH